MVASSGLFVADIPQYLTDEQFQNLWANVPGLLDARLRRDKKDRVVGFVDFVDVQHAARARDQFQGYSFDFNHEHGISIHFTKSNPSKRRPSEDDHHSSSSSTSGGAASELHPIKIPQDLDSNCAQNKRPTEGKQQQPGPFPLPNGVSHPMGALQRTYQPNNQNVNPELPARSTLYIEGIPTDATEREVSHIFRHYEGFVSLRLFEKAGRKGHYILCFVEFDNKDRAAQAMNCLQGYKFDPKNNHRGIAIRYARQRGSPASSPMYPVTPPISQQPNNQQPDVKPSPNPLIPSPVIGFDENFAFHNTKLFDFEYEQSPWYQHNGV